MTRDLNSTNPTTEMSEPGARDTAAATASISQENGSAVLILTGELDLSTIHGVREAVDAVIRQGSERLVIDLTEVTFMDTSGIALLLWIAKRIPRTELRNPSPIIRQVLDMTGLGGTLPITQ